MVDLRDPETYRIDADTVFEDVDLDEVELYIGGRRYREVDALADSLLIEMSDIEDRLFQISERVNQLEASKH